MPVFGLECSEGRLRWYEASPDGLIFAIGNGDWFMCSDSWHDGMPEVSCEEAAELEFPPLRGFGLVWCQHISVREIVGEPVEGEKQIDGRLEITEETEGIRYKLFEDNELWYQLFSPFSEPDPIPKPDPIVPDPIKPLPPIPCVPESTVPIIPVPHVYLRSAERITLPSGRGLDFATVMDVIPLGDGAVKVLRATGIKVQVSEKLVTICGENEVVFSGADGKAVLDYWNLTAFEWPFSDDGSTDG